MLMIQLTRRRFICSPDLDALTRQFADQHSIRLPQLLHPELIRIVSAWLERDNWFLKNHGQDGEIARELKLDDPVAYAVLHFVTNTPEFLRVIERITQCHPIVCFSGRVYRRIPDTDHFDTWHDDVGDDRVIGMSVNLAPRPYSGGVFRIRKQDSDQILCELPNTVSGDAILFRISPELTHMVTMVVGTEAKTAFAGWFKSSGRDFFTGLPKVMERERG